MQKFFGSSARLGLGFALLLAIGCGGSSHTNTDAKDAPKESGGGGTGGGGTGGIATGGIGGATGGTGGATAGTDGGAGTGGATAGTGGAAAGTDGGAGTGGAGGAAGTGGAAAGTDGGAGTGGAAAGTDGGAGTGGADAAAGAGGADAAAGTGGADAAAGTDGAAAGADGGADADANGDADANDAIACTPACTEGVKRCGTGGGVQTCVLDSNSCPVWNTEVVCGGHSVCGVSGSTVACGCITSTCTAVGQFCSGGNTRTNCAQDPVDHCFFATGAATACGSHTTCAGAAGSATCDCNIDPSCPSETATFCNTTTSQSNCAKDADNCLYVASTTTCPTHESCTGSNPTGKCTCDPTPTGCIATGGTFCSNSNGSVTTCLVDTNSCVYIDHGTNCGTNQACHGPDGTASCSCNAAPAECPTGNGGVGFTCSAGTQFHCALDAQSCVFVDATKLCSVNQACNGGSGLCECNPGPTGCTAVGTFCDGGGKLNTCVQGADGCFTVPAGAQTCPSANQTCTGSLPGAACTCNAAPAICAGGNAGTYCSASNEVTTCSADPQGCVTASATTQTCGAHQSCGGTSGANHCVCNATDVSCTGNGTFCAGSGAESTCTVDGDNCPFVSVTAASCPTHQSCKGAGLGTSCSCDNTCTAAQAGSGAGTYCTDGAHVASCTNDVLGCHIAAAPAACAGTRTCQGADGSGACLCRAVGTTVGTSCTSAGATLCQGNVVLTCMSDGTGCNTWVSTTDCTLASLVCGTKIGGGASSCQCAENADGNYYVGTNGNDTSAISPTGLNAPDVCRFKTLGKGLAAATTAGNQVIATFAGGSGSFPGESFPLTVSAGVTLTTADGTHTPANYIIDFTGAGSAVTLGGSSTLDGFMISNAGGNASSSGVLVSGTGAVISHVDLEGTGGTMLANGVAVTGTSQAAISNSTISGFSTGIAVSTSAASAVTLSSSTVSGNGTNIGVSNGTLTATTVTVSGASGIGVSLAAGAGSISAINGTGLTISGNTGAGVSQSGATSTLNYTSGSVTGNGGGGLTLAGGTTTLGTVNVTGNTGAGVTVSGGALMYTSGTLGTNSGGGLQQTSGSSTFATVDINTNTGAGITTSGGTVTLGATTVQKNTTRGISQSGATSAVVVGAATISTNTTDGIFSSAGTLAVNTGAVITKNGGTGITSGGALTFGGAAATPISVNNNTGAGVSITAGSLTANYLTIDTNGAGATKASGLLIAGPAAIAVGTATDAAILVTKNGLHGVQVNGTTSGSDVQIKKGSITSNGTDGLYVDFNGGTASPGAIGTFSNLTITGNGSHGVEVVRAPLVASAIKTTLDTLNASGNTGKGVYLHGSNILGSVGVLLKNSTMSSNTGTGLQIEASGAQSATTTIQGNFIFGNLAGGVVIGTRVTLNSFIANTIHGNTGGAGGGEQVLVSAGPLTGSFSFRSPSNTCDANSNKIYCYGGGVGLRVTSAATAVDAQNVTWTNAGPSLGVDYAVSGAGSSVAAGTPCTPNPACP